ncbi:transposon Tf2-9 polyprotein [Nephila pilipes]|uniref:Transposon Tf2-9 polyprotein n=1 Tax=Nephila pilipes TaxID=299642 RepID=A0A8X6PJ21_NEPPI|nr:transposon Tf2-9 polyprotein [Nephila pilipes]
MLMVRIIRIIADALSRIEIDAITTPSKLGYKMLGHGHHSKAPLGTFAKPEALFSHIHLDFIGPLPISDGKQYCHTIIIRFTRWSEVIPTLDITAEATARIVMHGWISDLETPVTITSN